jgi:hypothetical protein
MEKIRLFLALFLFFAFSTFTAQNQARIWYFGNGLGLNFTTSPPTVLFNGSMATTLGCTSICNSAGNLLFYSDGATVWNQTHAVMANGSGLFGTPGAQSSVVVKKPASNSLYYLFTVQGGAGPAGLCYSIIDMTLAGGNGSVTVKNATLFPFPCEEKISATKHCNQTDAWVLVHQANSNNFQSVLLTATGISSLVTSPIPLLFPTATNSYTHTGSSPLGTLKFSPNGRKVADVFTVVNPNIPFTTGGATTGIFETYDFDNNTGIINNIYWPLGFSGSLGNNIAYGTEWSPDGTKLYWTYLGGLMQLNDCIVPPYLNGTVPQLGDPLPANQWRTTLQLGPDGKIYVANPGYNAIGVINNPNNPATSCNYSPAAISTGSVICGRGLPNFYSSYFEKTSSSFTSFVIPTSNCQVLSFFTNTTCPVLPFATIPFSGYVVNNQNWNFGDPATGAFNTSTASAPTHSFSAPGTYTVQLLMSYLCGRTDTIRLPVTIYGPPLVSVTMPTLACGTTTAIVSATSTPGPISYSWIPAGITGSIASGLGPGTYTVRVSDNGNGCAINHTFSTNNSLIYNTVLTKTLCAYETVSSATAIVAGNSGPVSYTWTATPGSGSVITGLAPGYYSVTVTSPANNCTITTPFQVVQLSPLIVSVSPNVNGTLCTGNSALLSASASGGLSSYTYTWINGPASNQFSITSQLPGTYIYSVNVTDNLGCAGSGSIAIIFDSTPTLTAVNPTACAGSSVTLSAFGAATYSWLPGPSSGNTIVVSPTASSVYTVVGQTGICAALLGVTVTALPKPQLLLTSNSPLCAGKTLSLNVTGALSFLWTGPSGFVSTLQNPVVNQTPITGTGIYSLVGTGSNSCTSLAMITVSIMLAPNPQIISNSPLCAGQTLSLSTGAAAQFNWAGPGLNSAFPAPTFPNVAVNKSGLYSVTLTASNGCISTGTAQIVVNSNPQMTVVGPTVICIGDQAQLQVSGAGTYSWSSGPTAQLISVNPIKSITYFITGIDSNGCAGQTQHLLKVVECVGLHESNEVDDFRFSPNPFGNSLLLQSLQFAEVGIWDINSVCRIRASTTPGNNVIDTSCLSPGLYILKVQINGKLYCYKVVKM